VTNKVASERFKKRRDPYSWATWCALVGGILFKIVFDRADRSGADVAGIVFAGVIFGAVSVVVLVTLLNRRMR